MKTLTEKINTTTFLTDGGLETDLLFTKNIDLSHFAAFPLLDKPKYRNTLQSYYKEYMDIAVQNQTGFILESPTWRANTDWGYKLGYDPNDLDRVNKKAIQDLKQLRSQYLVDIPVILVSGQIGPRGDGYLKDTSMSSAEAYDYHLSQIKSFQSAEADMVTALTMTYAEEAIGICLAAREQNLPVVISFTVETNGHLPNGSHLGDVIKQVDEMTDQYPSYYMINCAHPSHFIEILENAQSWTSRIRGIRANASCKSHEELDDSSELDSGDKADLAQWHGKLISLLPELRVFGGCCGADASHVASICQHILSK